MNKVSTIDEGLVNLFRTIISLGLENKSKNPRITYANLSNGNTVLENQIDINKSLEDIQKLENELLNSTNLDPPYLLSTIAELTAKIEDRYGIISGDETYAYDNIYHSVHLDMYRAIRNIRDDLVENLEDNLETLEKYPYLFTEIIELNNFWKLRLNALERKQARRYLVRIDYYFSKIMYKKVSEVPAVQDYGNDLKLLIIKLKNKIGVAYMYLDNYKDAEEKFNEILKIDELNTDALFNLGLIYQEARRKG